MTSMDIKKTITISAANLVFKDNIEKLVVSALLFKYVQSILQQNNSEANNLKSLVDANIKSYRTTVSELNGKYISYKRMRDIVKKSNHTLFVQFNDALIDEIHLAYTDTTVVVPFSMTSFSQNMYGIGTLNFFELGRLGRIHHNIMVPIAKYYHTKLGISAKSLQIETADEIPNNPGKVIYFFINGVPNTTIAADIMNSRMGIQYHNVSIVGDFVRLVTN